MFMFHSARKLVVVAVAAAAVTLGSGCNTTNKRASLPQSHMLSGYEDFDTAGERAPSAKTLYRLAKLLESQQRLNQAETVFKSSIERYPAFSPAYTELAAIQLQTNRRSEAIATLMAGIEKQPKDHVLLNNYGMCMMIEKNFNYAFEAFSKARDLEPNNKRYTANAALALGMLGRTDEALSLYRTILPTESAHQNLSVISTAMGVTLKPATSQITKNEKSTTSKSDTKTAEAKPSSSSKSQPTSPTTTKTAGATGKDAPN